MINYDERQEDSGGGGTGGTGVFSSPTGGVTVRTVQSRYGLQTNSTLTVRNDQGDAIVGPTVPITPPKISDLQSVEAYQAANLQSLRNTSSLRSVSTES